MKRDVLVTLLTGFGKSARFQCLPALCDKLGPTCGLSIVVIVTPLTAIERSNELLFKVRK